jgi:hypothetical protein
MDSNDHIGTPPKHEDEIRNSDDDLIIFDLSDESYDPDDCCHHIEKVSTNI